MFDTLRCKTLTPCFAGASEHFRGRFAGDLQGGMECLRNGPPGVRAYARSFVNAPMKSRTCGAECSALSLSTVPYRLWQRWPLRARWSGGSLSVRHTNRKGKKHAFTKV